MKSKYSPSLLSMLEELRIPVEETGIALERLSEVDSRFLRDLKLNIKSVLGSTHFSRQQALLLALAVAVNDRNTPCAKGFEVLAKEEGASDAQIAEVYAGTSLMGTNNVLYRFRHFMAANTFYENQPAGIRMSTMMNPVGGKLFFELLSLMVSALNGCERCVTSHEASVKEQGGTEAQIFDAIRLGSVIRGLCTLI